VGHVDVRKLWKHQSGRFSAAHCGAMSQACRLMPRHKSCISDVSGLTGSGLSLTRAMASMIEVTLQPIYALRDKLTFS
jgi:hypothetical protein